MNYSISLSHGDKNIIKPVLILSHITIILHFNFFLTFEQLEF